MPRKNQRAKKTQPGWPPRKDYPKKEIHGPGYLSYADIVAWKEDKSHLSSPFIVPEMEKSYKKLMKTVDHDTEPNKRAQLERSTSAQVLYEFLKEIHWVE